MPPVSATKVCPACKAELPSDAEFCPHDGTNLGQGAPTGARTAVFYTPPDRGEMILGRYRTIRPRSGRKGGTRGVGEFIEARDMHEGRVVLIQVYPPPHGTGSGVRRQAMRQQAERLLGLELHGSIPVLHAAEDADKNLVVVSAGAIGFSLAELLEHTGPLSAGRAVRIGADVADILHKAHTTEGVLHLALRPDVVFLVREGDFERAVVGGWRLSPDPEPSAASVPIPEEAAGDNPDERSDVYLVGALLYRLLTCTFGPEAPSTVAPSGADIPWDLESLVMRAMNPDPRARPQSAGELARLLQDCRCYGSWTKAEVRQSWATLPINDMTGVDGASMTTLRPPTRPRTLLWAAAGLLTALLLGILFLSGGGPPESGGRAVIAPRSAAAPMPTPVDPVDPALPALDDPAPDAGEAQDPAPHEAHAASTHRRRRPKAATHPSPTAEATVPSPDPPTTQAPPALSDVPEYTGGMGEPPLGHPAFAHLQRGRALSRSGKHGAALEQLDKAYSIAPLPVILRDMAQTYAALNDVDKATVYFARYRRKAKVSKVEQRSIDRLLEHLRLRAKGGAPVPTDPGGDAAPAFGKSSHDPKALYRAAALSYEAGDYRTALVRFKDAYAISPKPELEYNIGVTLEQLGRADQAITWLQRFQRRPGVTAQRRTEVSERLARLGGGE